MKEIRPMLFIKLYIKKLQTIYLMLMM